MKKKWLILLILFFIVLFTSGAFFMSGKNTKKNTPSITYSTNTTPTDIVQADVLEKEETEEQTFFTQIATLFSCIGPDGKTAQASKKDCDNVWNFWKNLPKIAGISSTSAETNNNSNNSSSTTPTPTVTPTATPTVTPTPTGQETPEEETPENDLMQITDVTVLPCTSTSCGNIVTVIATGVNFPSDAYMYLVSDGGIFYSEFSSYSFFPADAMLVNRDGATELSYDFFNLPCDVYTVGVYSASLGDSASKAYDFSSVLCN